MAPRTCCKIRVRPLTNATQITMGGGIGDGVFLLGLV